MVRNFHMRNSWPFGPSRTRGKSMGPPLSKRISKPTVNISGERTIKATTLTHISTARLDTLLAKKWPRDELRIEEMSRAAEPNPIAATSFPISPGISSMWLRHSSSKRSLWGSGSFVTARLIRRSIIHGVHAVNSRVSCLPTAPQTICERKLLISSTRVLQWWTPLHERLPAHGMHPRPKSDRAVAEAGPLHADRQPPNDSLTNVPALISAIWDIAFPTLT